MLTSCMWKQLCVAHECTCDVLVHHFYSSAAVLFADAASSRRRSAGPWNSTPSHSAPAVKAGPVRSSIGAASRTSTVGSSIARPSSTLRSSSAINRPVSAPRTSSATRAAAPPPTTAQRRGVSPNVIPVAYKSQASRVVTDSPSSPASLRVSNIGGGANEVVTIPGIRRTVSPVRRGQLIPAPAPSVKALFEERRRCVERRDVLRESVDHVDVATASEDPVNNSRRLSVLHSGPVEHQRTIVSQRSPVARRTSPVRSSGDNSNGNITMGSGGGRSLNSSDAPAGKAPVVMSTHLRRSPVRRTPLASPVLLRTSVPNSSKPSSARGVQGSAHLSAVGRPGSSSRERSASTAKSERMNGLADPRVSGGGGLSSRGVSPRTNDGDITARSTGTNASATVARRPSPQARRSSGVLPPPAASGGARRTPRQHAPSARSSSCGFEAPSIDYVVEVFKCGVNRTLEVDVVPADSDTPLRPNDLLLEVDGKSMSTVDQLRAHFELMYRSHGGRRAPPVPPPMTTVSLLRGTEFLVIDIPLPRTCGGGACISAAGTRSQSPAIPPAALTDSEEAAMDATAAPVAHMINDDFLDSKGEKNLNTDGEEHGTAILTC
jgi:hypothetical protein